MNKAHYMEKHITRCCVDLTETLQNYGIQLLLLIDVYGWKNPSASSKRIRDSLNFAWKVWTSLKTSDISYSQILCCGHSYCYLLKLFWDFSSICKLKASMK